MKDESLFKESFLRSRRSFLAGAGGAVMSASAVALLASTGHAIAAPLSREVEQDIRILNTAIAAEHEAVAAYQVGAESGLLSVGVLKTAVSFQSHHKEHVDVLSGTVMKLGGTPAEAKQSYPFPVSRLKRDNDVLEFAAGLERGAVSAYAGAIPLFDNRDLAAAAASILADEAMHWAVLRSVLGLDPVPGAFFS